jgi:sterol desaturase/sphingolipid hydroxylase (fatty acid hydroxylase superfamily)
MRPFLVFGPWLLGLGIWAGQQISLTWTQILLLPVGGLLVWTLVEWVFHRGMHLPVRSEVLSRMQSEAHIRHHREPHDVENSVVSVRGSIPLALVFFGLFYLAWRDVASALLFHAGFTLGYLAYEFVHLATHARWRVPGISFLVQYHNRHHYQSWQRTFGVTSPLWDWVFGSLPKLENERERKGRGKEPSAMQKEPAQAGE